MTYQEANSISIKDYLESFKGGKTKCVKTV